MRSTGELPKSWAISGPGGQAAAPGRTRFEQAGHTPVGGGRLHHGERGVHRRALRQGGALAPALALLGHDPHEEERPHPVHAGGRADVLAERESTRTSSTPVSFIAAPCAPTLPP